MGDSNVTSNVVIQDTVEGKLNMTPFAKKTTAASGTVETGMSAITAAIFQLDAPGQGLTDAAITGASASGAFIKFHGLTLSGTIPSTKLAGQVIAFGTKIQGAKG